jgi:hypothetical protein
MFRIVSSFNFQVDIGPKNSGIQRQQKQTKNKKTNSLHKKKSSMQLLSNAVRKKKRCFA